MRGLERLPAIGRDPRYVEVAGRHRGNRIENTAVVIDEKYCRFWAAGGPADGRESSAHRAREYSTTRVCERQHHDGGGY